MIGYDSLNDANREVFDQFLANWLAAQGTDARKKIVPVSVRFVTEGRDKYLRFDFLRDKEEAWLHVRSAYSWD